MKLVGSILLLFGVCDWASGAVATSASCEASYAGTVVSTSGATSCHAEDGGSASTGSISSTQTVSTNSYTSTFTLSGSAGTSTPGAEIATVTVNGVDTESLLTPGPSRPGILTISIANTGDGVAAPIDFNTRIDSFAQSCQQMTPNYFPTCSVAPTNGSGIVTIPITLGTTFSYQQTVSASAPRLFDAKSSITVSAFEADGTTPVALRLIQTRCDENGDGVVNVIDVQRMVNQVLGFAPPDLSKSDLNNDKVINVQDVQIEANSATSGACQAPTNYGQYQVLAEGSGGAVQVTSSTGAPAQFCSALPSGNGNPCTYSFPYGTTVYLQPQPQPGYQWQMAGDGCDPADNQVGSAKLGCAVYFATSFVTGQP